MNSIYVLLNYTVFKFMAANLQKIVTSYIKRTSKIWFNNEKDGVGCHCMMQQEKPGAGAPGKPQQKKHT